MSAIDSDQFSLRWNNFHSNMTTEFHALLQEEDLVDVTLAADGKFTQAHKIVLSVCSPYFKELFKVNPCKHPIVILKDVGHKELLAILQFMYKGEVNVSQEDLTSFLKTAELLQIKGLTGDDSGKAPVQSSVPRSVHRGDSSISNSNSKPQNLMKSRLPSLALLDDYLRSPPPQKRPRSSDPVPLTLSNNRMSARTLSEDSIDNSRTAKSEFIQFKEEPLDECDMEDDEAEQEVVLSENGKPPHESLIQVVKGESSQNSSSQPEGFMAAAAASLFASVSTLSLPQDSGGLQDGGQGVIRKPRRMPKLVHNGYKYVREWSANNAEAWVCCEYRRWDCQVRCCVIEGEVTNINGISHNHAPHYDVPIEMRKIRHISGAQQSCIMKY